MRISGERLENILVFMLLSFSFLFFVPILIQASGTFVVEYDDFGYTKLHHMCLDDKLKLLLELSRHPFNQPDEKRNSLLFDVPDKYSKSTPLHILVEKAAILQEKDYILALEDEKAEVVPVEDAEEVVQGSDPKEQKKKKKKKTEKMTVSIVEIIRNLFENHGVSLTAQTDSGWTPLNKAVYLASDFPDYPLEIIDILLNQQPESCAAAKLITRSQTALHFAAASRLSNSRAKVIVEKIMKACGSSINYGALNNVGWTAMKVAIAAGNTDVAALLKDKTPSLSPLWFNRLGLVGLLLTAAGLYYHFYIQNALINQVVPIPEIVEVEPTSEAGSRATALDEPKEKGFLDDFDLKNRKTSSTSSSSSYPQDIDYFEKKKFE